MVSFFNIISRNRLSCICAEKKNYFIPCFQACGWWNKNNKKNMMQKQSQTLLYPPRLVRQFPFIYKNAVASRMHAIISVLAKNTKIYLIILFCTQLIQPGRNIPTQAIIDLIHWFRKACVSLHGWHSLEVECGGVTSGGNK